LEESILDPRKTSLEHPQEPDWESWAPQERAVLCFIQADDRLLLIRKKRGLGAGKINGPGGRIDEGETALEAAVRETEEEVRLTPLTPRWAGELFFQFTDGYALHCTVFAAETFRGTPRETAEARPFWCPVDSLPYEEMWADDRLWIPHLLAGKAFRGYFLFHGDQMLTHRLEPARD
jgi:8-oxo-dGTP diphosphatase